MWLGVLIAAATALHSPPPQPSFSRRAVLSTTAAALGGALAPTLPALAITIDPDAYGDKELKLATVNKIRQNIRNECLKDMSLLPSLLKLTLSDIFSYRADTGTGGIDGSILLELDRPSSKGLSKVAGLVKRLHSELQRTTEISYADVVAFAGAAAIEAVGGPKVTVQLGRDDAKAAEPEGAREGFSWEEPTLDALRRVGREVGLSGPELVAMVGALGTLELAAKSPLFEEEDDDEFADIDPDGKAAAAEVGGGASDAIYGRRRGDAPSRMTDERYYADQKLAVDVRVQKIGTVPFDSTYFIGLLDKSRAADLTPLESEIVADKELKKAVEDFSKSKQKFRTTVRATYARLQALGLSYLGAARMLDESS